MLLALSFVLAFCVSWGQNLIPGEFLVEAGLLCALIVALVLRLGTDAVRHANEKTRGLVDASTGLYNERGLSHHSQALLAAAGEPVALSVAVLDFSDLVEVHSIYGSGVSRELIGRIVRKMNRAAGSRGLAARIGKTQFALVMPGSGQDRAREILRRVLGHPCRIEFDAGHSEIVLVPEVLTASATPRTESVADLCAVLAGKLARVREDSRRRRQYLQRERERHSRPMSFAAEPPTQVDAPSSAWSPVRPTVPLPLAPRD